MPMTQTIVASMEEKKDCRTGSMSFLVGAIDSADMSSTPLAPSREIVQGRSMRTSMPLRDKISMR